jgi:transcriptional regulator with XRE-family HTH domain
MDHVREEKIIKEFGKRLKKARIAKKLSLRALADIADMDFGNISEIETGKVNPSLTTIVLLAEALEVDPSELLPFKK